MRTISVRQWFRMMRAEEMRAAMPFHRLGGEADIIRAMRTVDDIHGKHNPKLESIPVFPGFTFFRIFVEPEHVDSVLDYIQRHKQTPLYQGPSGEMALGIDASIYARLLRQQVPVTFDDIWNVRASNRLERP